MKQGKVFENLVHISQLQDGKLDAASIVDFTLHIFNALVVSTDLVISQCYDGANMMPGRRGGVQAIIQQKLGRAIPYPHCFNHS